jgi:hypothetical protein
MENHKTANNSATTKAQENICADKESQKIRKNFDACLTKFKNNHSLLNKVSHRLVVTTNY